MDGGEGGKVVIVGKWGGRSHEWGRFERPPDSTRVLSGLVASTHDVMFVFYEVVVEMNIMGPDPSLVWETDLLPVGDMIGDGAVVDGEGGGRCDMVPRVKGLVD